VFKVFDDEEADPEDEEGMRRGEGFDVHGIRVVPLAGKSPPAHLLLGQV
jgi:hypothetical protein